MRHFTDQTTEATTSKFDSGVLYSIRMRMEIIKSVLIEAFFLNFFSLSALYFKDLFRFLPYLDTSIRVVLVNAIIKTGKDACTYSRRAFTFI